MKKYFENLAKALLGQPFGGITQSQTAFPSILAIIKKLVLSAKNGRIIL